MDGPRRPDLGVLARAWIPSRQDPERPSFVEHVLVQLEFLLQIKMFGAPERSSPQFEEAAELLMVGFSPG
jgi:hypothetical protein